MTFVEMDVFCIGLIFSRDQYRYRTYALQYAEALLRLQKHIAIFSPGWIEIRNELLVRFRDHSDRIHCFPIEESQDQVPDGNLSFLVRNIKLTRTLHQAERSMKTKIDFVFFAPVDDWIKPKIGKKVFELTFPYYWSGIMTQTQDFEGETLPLNIDPKFGDIDYLFTSEKCVGVATLDRFNSENLKSRVYKKVVVMPDVSDLSLPPSQLKVSEQIKKMARDRMVVGTILLEDENPENFLSMALTAAPDAYFFVCAGKLDPEHLNENSRSLLNELLLSGRQNNYFVLEDFEDSQSINDLVRTFDVCYLNDGQFRLPHPLLTKAAWFSKPVLGSKNDMVGKLLTAFKTGITVNGKVNESLQALATLKLQMPFERNFDMAKLRNYARLQNQDALRDSLEMLLLF
jgi:hypothetical protein